MSEYCTSCSPAPGPISAGCTGRASSQCVDISLPVVLAPTTSLGTVIASCSGAPTVSCVTNEEGTTCTVTLTQRLCVSIPVTFGITADPNAAAIACADHSC